MLDPRDTKMNLSIYSKFKVHGSWHKVGEDAKHPLQTFEDEMDRGGAYDTAPPGSHTKRSSNLY